MALPAETNPEFADYAHPERLVSTEWLAQHLGEPGLVVVESDEDVLLYDTGHIPGAVKIDWHLDLNDPVTRDYVDGAGFAALMARAGIDRDSTVVIYGDRNNWWAAYALWVFTLFGHPDVRLLDGGRAKWLAEGRDSHHRCPGTGRCELPGRRAVRRGHPRVQGRRRRPPGSAADRRPLARRVHRRAHAHARIPGRGRAPRWAHPRREVGAVGARRGRGRHVQAAPRPGGDLPAGAGTSPDDDVIAYCRIGERSSHTWFVLHHLLGFDRVRNYDGSWTEWGNAVRVPIAKGAEPGSVAGG